MPRPPPRLISSTSTPWVSRTAAASPTTRCAATSNPAVSKICEPMCECRPPNCSDGASRTAATARAADPSRSENPNFWSSCAVAMNSWVCASTPTVTRTITRCTTPATAAIDASAFDLVEGIHDDVSDTGLDTSRQLGGRLVVAVHADAFGREPGGEGHREFATGAHVESEALLGDPAGDGGAQKGLAGVVDAQLGERRAVRASTSPQIVLVEEQRRRAVLLHEVGYRAAADLQDTIDALGGRRPDDCVERIEIRRCGSPVRLREHVRVARPGRMC